MTPSACPPYQPQSAEPFLPMETLKSSVGSSISECGPSDALLPPVRTPPLLPRSTVFDPPSAAAATVHTTTDAQERVPTPQTSRTFPPGLLFRPLSNRSSTGSSNKSASGGFPTNGSPTHPPITSSEDPIRQDSMGDDDVFIGSSSFGRMQQSQLI